MILDIRTEKEFEAGHLEKAVNIDFYRERILPNKMGKLDKAKAVSGALQIRWSLGEIFRDFQEAGLSEGVSSGWRMDGSREEEEGLAKPAVEEKKKAQKTPASRVSREG